MESFNTTCSIKGILHQDISVGSIYKTQWGNLFFVHSERNSVTVWFGEAGPFLVFGDYYDVDDNKIALEIAKDDEDVYIWALFDKNTGELICLLDECDNTVTSFLGVCNLGSLFALQEDCGEWRIFDKKTLKVRQIAPNYDPRSEQYILCDVYEDFGNMILARYYNELNNNGDDKLTLLDKENLDPVRWEFGGSSFTSQGHIDDVFVYGEFVLLWLGSVMGRHVSSIFAFFDKETRRVVSLGHVLGKSEFDEILSVSVYRNEDKTTGDKFIEITELDKKPIIATLPLKSHFIIGL